MTGWNVSIHEMMELGERAVTMARIFNVREGFTVKDDDLPERLYEPLEAGTPGEKRIDRREFARGIELYYEAMGWDRKTGIPADGRLAYLGLEWLMDQEEP